MRFFDLIKQLENETRLPIEPARIVKILREGGAIDQVQFIGVRLRTSILRGKFVRVVYDHGRLPPINAPYSVPEEGLVAKIYYAINQEPEYIRLVINKELLHLTDPIEVHTSSREQIIRLADRLRLPTELLVAIREPSDSIEAIMDYLGDYRAVVAMVPQQVRDLICQKHAQKKLDEGEIAELVGIPLKYVSMLLSDQWGLFRSTWMKMPD